MQRKVVQLDGEVFFDLPLALASGTRLLWTVHCYFQLAKIKEKENSAKALCR
jgi:hypothetical protein